jgi:hypothetical protein
MPIVAVKDQNYHPQGNPDLITMNKRGGKKTRMQPTEGSSTQKRKANKAAHKSGSKAR